MRRQKVRGSLNEEGTTVIATDALRVKIMQHRYIVMFAVVAAGLSLCGCDKEGKKTLTAPPPVGTVPVGADSPQAREAAAREAQKQAALQNAQKGVPEPQKEKTK